MSVQERDIAGVTAWIKAYISAAGRENAIVGLSGGIDSAVIAALCTKALGRNRVIAVALPCPENGDEESSDKDYEDAQMVADELMIELLDVSIYGPTILMFHEVFKGQEADNRMALGNIKARMRMTALYAMAELYTGLVVGTTNRTEAILGYFTKYGDGGVDIEPILEFHKYEVREMAERLEIPCDIIDKPPSAGLWPGQTDEGELGFTYDEIDNYIENRHKLHMEFDPKLVKRVTELELQNRHKNGNLPHYRRMR